MTQSTSGNAGLHVRYEKAGLILDALPIPWNADAAIVEANVRLPKGAPRDKQDFTLQLSSGESASAELIAREGKNSRSRVFFRFAPPRESCTATVRWRDHVLGEVELPTVAMAAFVDGLTVEMPSIHVTLKENTVACRAIVHAQAKTVHASAILRSPVPLAPALGLGLRVHVQDEWGAIDESADVPLTSEQMRARQALVTARLPKFRRGGSYRVSWYFGPRCLHVQTLRTLTAKAFQRSLRITATRFLLYQANGAMMTVRSLPLRDGKLALDGIAQMVPCFYVCSGEAGAVGLAPFKVRALVGETITTLAIEDDALVTDGPTPVVLGAVKAEDAPGIKHFTLACGDTVLGHLPLLPTAAAELTAEGGFAPLEDYLWSPAAEEQLQDRLGKLLDEE